MENINFNEPTTRSRSPSPQRGFYLHSKNIFLTYPQCTLPLQILLEFFCSLSFYAGCIISTEYHEDGSEHKHALVTFSTRKNIRTSLYFDLHGFHPNIQSARNLLHVKQYVCKGGNYIKHGCHLNSNISSNVPMDKRAILGKLINGESSLVQLVEENPQFIMDYEKLKRNLDLFEQDQIIRDNELSITELNLISSIDIPGSQLSLQFKFFNTDLEKPVGFRGTALYCFGEPRSGKTTWINTYFQSVIRHIYFVNEPKNWYGFNEKLHRVIVFEDFTDIWDLATLIRIIDGKAQLNIKYGQVRVTKRIGVLFISNIHPKDVGKDTPDTIRKAFWSRLWTLEMEPFNKIKELTRNDMYRPFFGI